VKVASGRRRGPSARRSNGSKTIVAEPEIGEIYDGKVVKVMDFGAFVNFFGRRTVSFTFPNSRRVASARSPMSSRKATR